jgi:predicted PurR-regulated permease PerM
VHKNRFENYSFVVLFAGISLLLFFVFAPFVQILALAAVFATIFHRPYEKLARYMGKWKSPAALIVVGFVLVFCIVPLFFLGFEMFHEAQSLYAGAQGNGAQYVQTIETAIEHPIRSIVPGFSLDISAAVGSVLSFISTNLASIVYQTFYVILETSLMLLAFFFFLRDGRSLLAAIAEASPLGKDETQQILNTMYQTIRSVVRGTFLVGLIRLLLIGIGFYIFHIPNAILWGSIGGIIGAIPGLGTPFVFIPAVAYLYLNGNVVGAVGLALFGCAVVFVVDNMLAPYFFGRGLAVPPVFVLFAVLGGIIFFGPLGFILGPLVLSVFLSVFRIYSVMAREIDSEK